MPRLTGGEAVVAQLEREGVDVAFGIPGVHTLSIYDALIDSEIDHLVTRHEQGAGFMADGYARATGRVGVLLVITGPGLTNAATAIGQAYSDSSPLVVISSHHRTPEADQGKGLLHELRDQRRVMEGLVADTERVSRVADLPGAIADAFDHVRTRRPRPVHVDVPLDVLETAAPVDLAPSPAERPARRPSPDPERLAEAADLIDAADAPVVLAGGGAADAAPALRGFVERTGLPVVTTAAGRGVVPADHPLHLGTTATEGVADALADRDLALAVGSALSPRDVEDLGLPEALIHVDLDRANLDRTRPATVGIVADATETVEALDDRVRREGGADGPTGRSPAPLWPSAEHDHRHRILAALREGLDDDAILVNDMTKVSYAALGAFPSYTPRSFQFPRGFGTLGFSPPAAYGAGLALPDRQVAAVVGDGGFMFTVQDLATAVKYEIGVPVVLVNDESYEVVRDAMVESYGRSTGTDIANPEFVALAESFGAATERVDVEAVETELPAALAGAFDRGRPTVIEVPVGDR
jgi:thiamine pyrophosphate-dependent acetolactate synthase large subunit-like protein